MEFVILAFGLIYLFVQIGLTVAVYGDARRIDTARLRLGIGPGLWAGATLIGGVVAVGIYWIIYHSSLRSEQADL